MASVSDSTTAPFTLLLADFRALLPNLLIDIGGSLAVYYGLLPHFAKTSLVPLVGASLVPLVSVVFGMLRHRRLDVIGVIVFAGMLGSLPGMLFGGDQRWLLVRESFFTGFAGLLLFVSPLFRKPLGYYVAAHFFSAHNTLGVTAIDTLWESAFFRKTIRFITFFWGLLLLGEFGLRVFMAFALPIVFVLGVGPLILNALMLGAGALSALAFSRAMRVALA